MLSFDLCHHLPLPGMKEFPRVAAAHYCQLGVLVFPIAFGTPVFFSGGARADVFGRCAHEADLERKLGYCTTAIESTPYPWIHQWIYVELARTHRQRSEWNSSLVRYQQALSVGEHPLIRSELVELEHEIESELMRDARAQ